MNRNNSVISKFLGCLLVVYLTVLFAVIIPLHHHNDLDSHDDCAVCAVSSQPFVPNVSVLVHVLFVLFIIFAVNKPQVQFFSQENLHLRSPPLA